MLPLDPKDVREAREELRVLVAQIDKLAAMSSQGYSAEFSAMLQAVDRQGARVLQNGGARLFKELVDERLHGMRQRKDKPEVEFDLIGLNLMRIELVTIAHGLVSQIENMKHLCRTADEVQQAQGAVQHALAAVQRYNYNGELRNPAELRKAKVTVEETMGTVSEQGQSIIRVEPQMGELTAARSSQE